MKFSDNDFISQTCEQLRTIFDEAVHRNLAEGILLSGGLDTSVVTAAASKYTKPRAVTVTLDEAPDVSFAKSVANLYGLEHKIVTIDVRETEYALRDVVKTMRTFDPMEVRNDVAILIGLRAAKEAGLGAVLTGDAGDELFAGYSFLFEKGLDQLGERLQHMWMTMRFSSAPLARSLGLEVKLPFLDDKLKEFAMQISPELKVREEKGRLYGKWILRKAFEGILPDNLVWRNKMPIEQGSGTTKLSKHFSSQISDSEFASKKKESLESDGVNIRDKEHLFYYEFFKTEFGIPRGTGEGSKRCNGCGAWLMDITKYCRTCGAYPA
jgi:asparagine synthase (glutamine-hydrolysing)